VNDYLVLGAIALLSPGVVFVVNALLGQTLRLCFRRQAPPQFVALAAAAIGFMPVAWLAWIFSLRHITDTNADIVSGFVYLALAHGGFSFCYFNVLNASETSLHVHILTEIFLERRLDPRELSKRYSASEMVHARIERMIALGQLREEDGFFVSGNRTLVTVGRVINTWRKVLGLPIPSG
jgi:hypothetical protein